MDINKLNRELFLATEVKKGLEIHNITDDICISIRGLTINNCLQNNKPLIVTVKDIEGVMLLQIENIQNPLDVSKKLYGNDGGPKYPIYRYKWSPLYSEIELKYLSDLITIKYDTQNKINNLLKVKDGIKN